MMTKRRPMAETQRDWLLRMDRTESRSGPARRMLDALTADAKRPDPIK